eukprot:2961357-Prymnesium_polylepis.1
MSRTVLTWWPTWDGSSFALRHAWACLARLGHQHHVEEQVGAVRRHADDERAVDLLVEGDHPVVDRVEKMRISAKC